MADENQKQKIRQAIVTVAGHVDHGKTSILDALRGTSIQEKEAGGITQKISFTLYPSNQLRTACPLIDKQGIKLDIPGFLFIDTPGHAAFTNLRKRGGNLADLAVLVIDINEGIKPQTAEVIQILKINKVPFVIALNKIDKISGWQTHAGTSSKENPDLRASIDSQAINVRQNFNEKYLTLIGSLQSHGFDSDMYYNITDFTKRVALVPCSARTQEGIPELILMLCGLSQRYLSERLKLGKDAKGIMLEVKKEQANYIEAILYDGLLKRDDEIAVASFDGKPILTRIRVLEEILPLSSKFKTKESALAATGLRLQLVTKEEILPGMPFQIYKNNQAELESLFKKEISETVKTSKQGIIAKADSLGSLEALLTLLAQEKIPVVSAGIGDISKTDIIRAKANLQINELDAVIVGFNVEVDHEASEIKGKIPIITEDVVYKLIERVQEFRLEKAKEIERKRLTDLAPLGKVTLLKQYVFRNTNPAVFGVRVDAGKIISGMTLIDSKNEKIGKIKGIQADKKTVGEASEGMEVAISVPGINYERRLKNDDSINSLYSEISESQFKNFKKNKDLLSSNELSLLAELAQIKEKSKEGWGQN